MVVKAEVSAVVIDSVAAVVEFEVVAVPLTGVVDADRVVNVDNDVVDIVAIVVEAFDNVGLDKVDDDVEGEVEFDDTGIDKVVNNVVVVIVVVVVVVVGAHAAAARLDRRKVVPGSLRNSDNWSRWPRFVEVRSIRAVGRPS